MYDCKAATVEDLDFMLRNVYIGKRRNSDLWQYVEEDIPKNIDWKQLRYIRVIGDDDLGRLEHFESIGLFRGFYLNAGGTWLLLILPEKPHLGDYFSRCGDNLSSLWIWNSLMYSRNANKFPGLQELSLRDNSQLDSIENLDKLTELNELTVENCPRLTEISCLESLKKLTHLDITNCTNLTMLPDLHSLPGLTHLNLTDCASLVSLSGLYDLPQLASLRLSGCRSLAELPDLNQFPQLMSLRLSGCRSLVELPDLGLLSKLTVLDLSDLQIDRIPESICRLNSLRYLDLSDSHIKKLPVFLPDIAFKFHAGSSDDSQWLFEIGMRIAELDVYSEERCNQKAEIALFNTTIEGVDMSIFEQPYEMVVKWFRDRNRVPLNEIKVVFLGDGEAGKSHTIARLMNDGGDPIDYMDKSTPGIVIKHRDYVEDGLKFQVHYWDFGGQEIMHSMHRIFLTNRTMYVVLINSRDDTQGDRANYWLQNIQSFAPDAPVLLVLNKIDQNPKASVDERTLRAKYKGLTEIVRLSALEFDKERFNREFKQVLMDQILKCKSLRDQWPQAWVSVKNRLVNMTSHYILGNEYTQICRECGVEANEAELLHWFNDLGVSFCFCDKEDYTLRKHVILRPDWITNALYIILFNECEGTRNGVVPHEAIYDLLERAAHDSTIRCTLPDASYNQPGDIAYVLGVMRKFQLSFDTGNRSEFIPMLCEQDATLDIHYYEQDAEVLEFHMDFEYLPDNLLHRLMVERHQELDLTNVWRKGGRFRLNEAGLSAVVVIDGDTLKFFVRHSDSMHRPNTYLTMLKAHVDRIVRNMGIKAPECRLIYKLDGKRDEFDYEDVKLGWELGDTTITSRAHRKKVLIKDVLNQSAPEGMEDEQKLLHAIRRSCLNIQGDMRYRGSEEDDRNTRIRDDLRYIGYVVHDQTRYGITESGKRAGELDLEIRRENNEPWTIIEGLRIKDGSKTGWNKHLQKLIDRYNAHGLRSLFLVAFADCDKDSFNRIWEGYRDDHIRTHDAGKFTYVVGSFQEISEPSVQLLKIAKCQYDCGGNRYTLYHIFLQMDPQ